MFPPRQTGEGHWRRKIACNKQPLRKQLHWFRCSVSVREYSGDGSQHPLLTRRAFQQIIKHGNDTVGVKEISRKWFCTVSQCVPPPDTPLKQTHQSGWQCVPTCSVISMLVPEQQPGDPGEHLNESKRSLSTNEEYITCTLTDIQEWTVHSTYKHMHTNSHTQPMLALKPLLTYWERDSVLYVIF